MNNNSRNNNRSQHSGHESVLKLFQKHEKRVSIKTLDGSVYTGTIKSFDRFTISLLEDGQSVPKIFFKSAIAYFGSIE